MTRRLRRHNVSTDENEAQRNETNSFGASRARINYTIFRLSGAIWCQRTTKNVAKITYKIKCENKISVATIESENMRQIYFEKISERRLKCRENYTWLAAKMPIECATNFTQTDLCVSSFSKPHASIYQLITIHCDVDVRGICLRRIQHRSLHNHVTTTDFNILDINQCQRSLFDECV